MPAVVISLSQGPGTAFYMVLLYLAIQMTEGYGITPLLQRHAIAMPPALLIAALVMLEHRILEVIRQRSTPSAHWHAAL